MQLLSEPGGWGERLYCLLEGRAGKAAQGPCVGQRGSLCVRQAEPNLPRSFRPPSHLALPPSVLFYRLVKLDMASCFPTRKP